VSAARTIPAVPADDLTLVRTLARPAPIISLPMATRRGPDLDRASARLASLRYNVF
jgi:hypothetical protein